MMTEHDTAAGERVMEGTWEEIEARATAFRGHRVRLTLLPPEREASPSTPDSKNLAESLGDYIGGVHGGGAPWSERTSEAFTDYLADKRQRGHL